MRSIARQKSAPTVKAFSHQGVKAVAGLAPQSALMGLQPTRQKLPSAFRSRHLFGVFARINGKFPTAVVLRDDQVGAGSLRFAILHTDLGQLGQALLVNQDVHHQPRLIKVQIL